MSKLTKAIKTCKTTNFHVQMGFQANLLRSSGKNRNFCYVISEF